MGLDVSAHRQLHHDAVAGLPVAREFDIAAGLGLHGHRLAVDRDAQAACGRRVAQREREATLALFDLELGARLVREVGGLRQAQGLRSRQSTLDATKRLTKNLSAPSFE